MSYLGFTEEQLMKMGSIHTAKEISQQPKLWKETVSILQNRKEEIQTFLDVPLNENKARVIFTGAGTSAYVGDTATPYVSTLINNHVESIATTDLVSSPLNYLKENVPTIVVSFARSGNSPESVGAFDLVKQIVKDAYQVVVTCNPDGDLANKARNDENSLLLLMPEASNDLGFAMTSSFSCMYISSLLLFNMDQIEKVKGKIDLIAEKAETVIQEEVASIRELVETNKKRLVYLGSSIMKGLSKEIALKNLELTSGMIPSFSESVLGFRHGPKSIVNDETLICLFISNNSYTRKYEIDLLKEMKNDGGAKKVAVICFGKDPEIEKYSDYVFVCGNENDLNEDDAYIALCYLIYGQIFAMLNSLHYDISPDNPNPAGIVNRVVKGVTLYPF